jgi:general secretion pathway protein G
MEIAGGKIYLVSGSTVYKIDSEKMELEKKRDLTEAVAVTAEDIIKRLDRNDDGKISKSEWQGTEQTFAKLDTNSDGFVTKDEIPPDMVERTATALKRLAARAGRILIKVDGPNLYIFKGGVIYKLKSDDLQIVKTLTVEETQELRTPERATKPLAPEGTQKKPLAKENPQELMVKMDMRAISDAIRMCFMDMGRYPKSLDELCNAPADAQNWRGPYLESLPKDPWGRPYIYEFKEGSTPPFTIKTYGRDGKKGGTGEDKDYSNLDTSKEEGK